MPEAAPVEPGQLPGQQRGDFTEAGRRGIVQFRHPRRPVPLGGQPRQEADVVAAVVQFLDQRDDQHPDQILGQNGSAERGGPVPGLIEQRGPAAVQHRGTPRHDGTDQPLLAAEVVVGDPGIAGGRRLGHLTERDRLHAALREQPFGRNDDLLGRGPSVRSRSPAGPGRHALSIPVSQILPSLLAPQLVQSYALVNQLTD